MYKQLINFFCLAIFLLGFSVNAHANACVAAASGAWETTSHWSTCGSTYPHSTDTVSIGNFQMTIPTGESDAATSVTFTASGGSITITSTGSLAVSGTITVNSIAAAGNTATLAGTGTITAGSVAIGANTPTPSATETTDLVSTIATFTDSGGVTLTSYRSTTHYNNPELEIQAGTLSATSITTTNANANNTATITMATGAETGILDLSAASPWSESGTGTTTTTLTHGTVAYTAAAGGQTVLGTTYANLTLSNTSGTDTAGAAVVVTGTLTTTSGGTFNMSTYQLTGAFTPTNSGTLKTSNTSNPAIPSGDTWGGTVQFAVTAGSQDVPAGTYTTLTFSNTSGTDTAEGAIAVNTALTTTSGGTFNMSTYQLTGAFTPTNSGTLKTSNTSNPAIPSGDTWGGTVQFAVTGGGQYVPAGTYTTLTFSNTSNTDTAAGAITATTLNTTSGGTLDMSTYALTVTTINNSGTVQTECTTNPPLSTGKTWGGTVDYDSTAANQTVAYGTYTNLTLADTGYTAALDGNTTVTGTVTVSSGTFDQGASYNLTTGTGALTIDSGGSLTDNGTGGLIVGSGGVSNSGAIEIDGSGLACGGSQSIAITSSSPGTQQSWSGSGGFLITDVTVRDQGGSAVIMANGSSSVSNNGSNWTISAGCQPSYLGGNGSGDSYGRYPQALIASTEQDFVASGLSASAGRIEVMQDTAGSGTGITTSSGIKIDIPSGLNMTWDPSITTATISGSASSKVSTTVSYANSNTTLVLTVTTNFSDGDYILIIGLNFKNFNSAGIGQLMLDTGAAYGYDADNAIQIISSSTPTYYYGGNGSGDSYGRYPPALLASTEQAFALSGASASAGTIEIMQDTAGTGTGINTSGGIKVDIPSGLNMTWDPSITTATISGGASGKVSATVSYANSNTTLVLTVTTNFNDGDYILVSGLNFKNFDSTGTGQLMLDTGATYGYDADNALQIISGSPSTYYYGGNGDGDASYDFQTQQGQIFYGTDI